MKLDNIGFKALNGLAVTGTLAAPITTGFVIYRALVGEKAFIPVIGLTAAAAVELLGFAASNVALAHWNLDAKNRRGPSLPTALSVIALLSYVGTATILTWVIEGDPTLALFPALSLVGSGVLALTQELTRRQAAERTDQANTLQLQENANQIQANRDKLAAERQARLDEQAHQERLAQIEARKATKIAKLQAQTVTGDSQGDTGNVTGHVTPDERRATLQALVTAGDTPNVTALARQFGVSRASIYKDLDHIGIGTNGNNGKATQ